MDFNDLLMLMVSKGGSDLFVTSGVAPSMKINGQILPVTKSTLSGELVGQIMEGIMTPEQQQEFKSSRECNFAITDRDQKARFRVSAFIQRDQPGMVLRRIETEIPRLDSLNLPPAITDLVMHKRGIIILVGATGTGKSTTMAAMIGHRNHNSRGHIITIEDPIEFVHNHAGCIITQREVGIDTESYEIALKNTLRQAPDVIVMGEIRTKELMEYAINFAETGHLVMATLHANNANQAIDRIINFFPSEKHHQLLMDISLNLRAVIAQQLVPVKDGNGRRVCMELMINTPHIAELIRKGELHAIKEAMIRSREQGLQTFDQALFDLYQEDAISYDEAMRHADAPNDLRLMIKLSGNNDSNYMDASLRHLSIDDSV